MMARICGARYVEMARTPTSRGWDGNRGAIKSLPKVPRLWLHARCRSRAAAVPEEMEPAGQTGLTRGEVMNPCRLNVFYSGTVQGVGFRYTVRTLAAGFDVAGSVRNLPDGRVELVAEGLKDELGAFRQAIRESELGHFIRREDVIWAEPAGGLRGFEIVS